MILALLSFTFSIAQVVVARDVISADKRFALGLTFALLSAIPVMVQLVTLVQELWRAGRYCFKLLFQRLILTCLGDYAQGLPLALMHPGPLNAAITSFMENQEAQGLSMASTAGGSLVKGALMHLFPAGWLTFRDPFSGEYQLTNESKALLLDANIYGEAEPWEAWYEGIESLDEDVWRGSKEIRGAEVFWNFGRVSDPSENVPRDVRVPAWSRQGHGQEFTAGLVSATRNTSKTDLSGMVGLKPKRGSGFLTKLKRYGYAAGFYETSEENYRTFCNLMKAVVDQTYFISRADRELLEYQNQGLTFHCLDLDTILTSILEDGKKVSGNVLFNTCYV